MRVAWVTGLIAGCACAALAFGFTHSAHAQEEPRIPSLVVERDPSTAAPEEFPLVLSRELAEAARAPSEGAIRWLGLGGERLVPGQRPTPGGIRLAAVEPGVYVLSLRSGERTVVALRSRVVDASGTTTDRAAVARSLPEELAFHKDGEKEEAVRVVVQGLAETLPSAVQVISLAQGGEFSDSLKAVPLVSVACPADPKERAGDLACASTAALRIATDQAERRHPALMGRAILGEVGGTLVFQAEGAELGRVPILAPAALEPGGPGRYQVKLRATVLTSFNGGPPAVGESPEEAQSIVKDEVSSASRIWGQCGVAVGPIKESDVRVVAPPELSMVTVGCGRGLPASGGTIRFSVLGRSISVRTHEGESPAEIAPRLAAAVRRSGARVQVFRNARPQDAALSSFDVVMKDASQRPLALSVPKGGMSDDPTLGVCLAELDLADGLEHFDDLNAATGTPEERYLLRALSDDDPQTIELLVVPLFGGSGRIGESFIHTKGGSLESALILDRSGVRAGSRSFTLAHELGHILLDLPGHPDDFGVDTPTSLMDADAADATVFGPRRLSLSDCLRGLAQSGRRAPVPLIFDWPLNDEKGGPR